MKRSSRAQTKTEAWTEKREIWEAVSRGRVRILRATSKFVNPVVYLLFSVTYIFVYFT